MNKQNDILVACLRYVNERISGAKIEIGIDGSLWLMPVDCVFQAMSWKTPEDFLINSPFYQSIFTIVHNVLEFEHMGWSSDSSDFALRNKWMDSLQSCSSLEELCLKMTCIG